MLPGSVVAMTRSTLSRASLIARATMASLQTAASKGRTASPCRRCRARRSSRSSEPGSAGVSVDRRHVPHDFRVKELAHHVTNRGRRHRLAPEGCRVSRDRAPQTPPRQSAAIGRSPAPASTVISAPDGDGTGSAGARRASSFSKAWSTYPRFVNRDARSGRSQRTQLDLHWTTPFSIELLDRRRDHRL